MMKFKLTHRKKERNRKEKNVKKLMERPCEHTFAHLEIIWEVSTY